MMLALFFILLFVLCIVVDWVLNRDFFSPVVIFCSLWTVISLFASLRLFGFTGYSDETMSLIGLGVLSFAIPALLSSSTRTVAQRHRSIRQLEVFSDSTLDLQLSLNYKMLKFLLCLVSIGTFLSLYYVSGELSSGSSLTDVRMGLLGYSDEETISNPVISGFVNYVCGPIKTVLMPLAIIYIVNKKHIMFSTAVLLNVIVGSISSGGRISILYAVLQALTVIGHYGISISKKAKRRIIGVIALGIALIMVLTMARGSSILYSIYSYFSIPFAIFQRCVDVVDRAGFYSYGASYAYPIFYVANMFVNAFGGKSDFLSDLVYYVGYPQDTWFSGIFTSGEFNAFSSLFYFFYMDFREFGIILFSAVFGTISGRIYSRSKHDSRFFLWYLLMAQALFGSFMIWQLGNTKFFLSMLILCSLQRKRSDSSSAPAVNQPVSSSSYKVVANG